MAYTEGYRGFQVSFSPRTAARIRHLRDRPVVAHAVLAPLFAMGFFRAARRTKLTTWVLTTSVVILIVLVQPLDQPWRGIVDSGVVAELTRAGRLLSVAGGGDTVAALRHAGVAQAFSYVSTAGGAFLEWLEGKTLPGVAALEAER